MRTGTFAVVVIGGAMLAATVASTTALLVLGREAGLHGKAGLYILLVTVAAAAAAGTALLLLQRRLIGPIDALARDIRTLVRNPQDRPLAIAADHALGALPDMVDVLRKALAEARSETRAAVAEATARAEEQKNCLEAILLDLAEGVVVCNLDHRILLYNQAAQRLLHASVALGLDRPLFATLKRDPVIQELERLVADSGIGGDGVRSFVAMTADGEPIEARLGLVREASGETSGYVLTFASVSAQIETLVQAGRPLPGAAPRNAPRPEYYDFDLFRPSRAAERDTPLRKMRFVVFDTETTGLEPAKGDELISIGAVRVVNGRLLTGESFERLIHPGRPIPPDSVKFHGITDDMVRNEPPARVVLPQFRQFVGDGVLVAYNIAFDLAFLAKRAGEAGVSFDGPALDALLLAAHLHPEEPDLSLSAMAHRFGVDITGRHTALGDALATAGLWLRLLDELEAKGVTTFGQAVDISDRMMKQRRARQGTAESGW